MNDPLCQICQTKLTQEDVTNLRIDDGYSIMVCKNHYCACLPDSTPYKWIEQCSICANYMCKSCGGYDLNGNLSICSKCHHVIERYKYFVN